MDYIPKLSEHLLIEAIENDSHYFLHQTDTDFRLKINKQTKFLLGLIDGQKSLSTLTDLFNAKFESQISREEVHLLIKDRFEPYGIVKTKEIVQKKDRAEYLKLRFTLIPDSIVSRVSEIFQFLIVDKIWHLIIGLTTGLIVFYALNITIDKFLGFINPNSILLYLPIALSSLLLHELGHAAACKKFKISPGSIGFGFYILIPVFYADVSDAWKIAPQKRIIVNIAGMYFQLLLSGLLVIIYRFTGNEWLLYASLFNILGFLSNLNPFVRYDGYWILSDCLRINNLMDKAHKKYLETLKWIKCPQHNPSPLKTLKDKFLFSYYFFNKAVIAIILFSIIFLKPNSIISFPEHLTLFIARLIKSGSISFVQTRDFFFNNIISILFYILVLNMIKKYLIRLKLNLFYKRSTTAGI